MKSEPQQIPGAKSCKCGERPVLTAILDVYRDEEKRELDVFSKLELSNDMTEDFTAMLLAIHVAMQELTGYEGDLIDATHALKKLAFQHIMEGKDEEGAEE